MRMRFAVLARTMACMAAVVLAALGDGRAQTRDPPPPPGDEAPAEGRLAVLLPTVLIDHGVRRPPTAAEPKLVVLASGLDGLLTDTAQDLGLVVDLTQRAPPDLARLSESDLPARAAELGAIVVWPSLEVDRGRIELRIVMAEPGVETLATRVERVESDELSVRAVVMLRDLVSAASRRDSALPQDRPSFGAPLGELAVPARSAGRGVLIANATIFGGHTGYAIQRSSGSDDPRLLYPLLAVGAGIGLGASVIAAEEWDVGIGDAWYLSAAAWWPTLGGHLIFEGRFAQERGSNDDERWTFGLVAGTSGLAIGTTWLTFGGVAEGGAMIAHSGGGLGLIFGGLAELFVDGDIYQTPFAGMGYGAALGWLVASAAGRGAHVTPARVLAVDLGAVLGGLGGAALASPLLFDSPTPAEQRIWLGAAGASALVGGGIALWATRNQSPATGRLPPGLPFVGVVGESQAGFWRAPALGIGWRGPMP